MNRSLRQNIALIIVVISSFDFYIVTTKHMPNPLKFPDGFDELLYELAANCHKIERPTTDTYKVHRDIVEDIISRRVKNPESHSSQAMLNAQKALWGDVLMLKLVSYYEGKYQLTPSTAKPIPNPTPPTQYQTLSDRHDNPISTELILNKDSNAYNDNDEEVSLV